MAYIFSKVLKALVRLKLKRPAGLSWLKLAFWTLKLSRCGKDQPAGWVAFSFPTVNGSFRFWYKCKENTRKHRVCADELQIRPCPMCLFCEGPESFPHWELWLSGLGDKAQPWMRPSREHPHLAQFLQWALSRGNNFLKKVEITCHSDVIFAFEGTSGFLPTAVYTELY